MSNAYEKQAAAPPASSLIAVPPAQRIHRTRAKGFRLPANTIYVGRPTLWGNPFDARHGGHARCTILHKHWLEGRIGDLTLEQMGFCAGEVAALHRKRSAILTRLHELAGCNLACWCPLNSQWCHAETYLALAPAYAELERLAA